MVKVISLSEEAYNKLKAIKFERSFSEVVVDLVERKKKKDLSKFFGIWAGREEEIKKMKKMIGEDRKRFKLREVKL
jgi:predicted CopG family antitoxin